jgi:hypothetical protein
MIRPIVWLNNGRTLSSLHFCIIGELMIATSGGNMFFDNSVILLLNYSKTSLKWAVSGLFQIAHLMEVPLL